MGIAREPDFAPVGGRQMDIDHLDGSELFQSASSGQARRQGMEAAGQGDLQAIGQEGDEDVGLYAPLILVEDRADRQVALQGLESLFDIP